MKTEKQETRHDLGRMTSEEYAALQEHHPPHGAKRLSSLGRLTEEEYKRLWNGNPPE